MRRIGGGRKIRVETNNETETSEPKEVYRTQSSQSKQMNINKVKFDTSVSNDGYQIYENTDFHYDASVFICMVLEQLPDPNTILKITTLRLLFKQSFLILCCKNSIENMTQINNSVVFYDTDETNCRNLYLNFVNRNRRKVEYMMVLDKHALDSDLQPGIFNCFGYSEHWDCIFANQSYKYYDIDSLVTNSTKEYHEETDENLKKMICKRLQYHIPCDNELIPVKSAFGGLGIYKTHVLQDSFYSDDGHRGFNLRIAETHRLFIDPSLVIKTSPDLFRFFM
jgi:hypothetical protein